MFRLLRYFSISSAIALAVVAAVLVVFFRQSAVDELIHFGEGENEALGRVFANAIWPKYADYIAKSTDIGRQDLWARPETRQIREDLSALVADLPVLKVKIYNLDGVTVFSSEAAQIGNDKSDNQGFINAKHGTITSELTHRGTFSAFEHTVEDRDVLSSYLPVYNADRTVAGVFEIYTDLTPLLRRIDTTTWQILVGLLLVSGILYVAFFFIIRHADNILKSQHAAILSVEQELRVAQEILEVRVRERTADLTKEIAERKSVEDALRASEERFRAWFESAPIGMSITGLDGKLERVNAALCRMLGYSEVELQSLSVPDIVHPSELEKAERLRHDLIEGRSAGQVIERKFVHRDGHVVWGLISGNVITDARGDPLYTIGQIVDVTERKNLETRLTEAQKMEALGQLTGGVAHEFNNLLMALTGYLEMMADRVGDREDVSRMVTNCLAVVFRGADLTANLLSYVGKQPVAAGVANINALVRETVDLLEPTLGEHVHISADLADNLWNVMIDPGRFKDALVNLAVNARDAMPDGGTITVKTANTHLNRPRTDTREFDIPAGDYVVVSVTDTGTGISPDVIDRAFDPFFTTKDVGKGTGLGLSMVYGFVRRQSGGFVDIESKLGKGTTLRLYFPRVRAGATAAEERPRPGSEIRTGAGTILLVEDDPIVSDTIADTLRTLGYAVETAANAAEALEFCEKPGNVDLFLTDVVLRGGASGPELANEIWRTNPDAKVIFMTGYSDDRAIASGVPEHGATLLQKPFDRDQIARTVADALAC